MKQLDPNSFEWAPSQDATPSAWLNKRTREKTANDPHEHSQGTRAVKT